MAGNLVLVFEVPSFFCLILFYNFAHCCLLDPLYWNCSSELLMVEKNPVLGYLIVGAATKKFCSSSFNCDCNLMYTYLIAWMLMFDDCRPF